jgi:hypothetical protein
VAVALSRGKRRLDRKKWGPFFTGPSDLRRVDCAFVPFAASGSEGLLLRPSWRSFVLLTLRASVRRPFHPAGTQRTSVDSLIRLAGALLMPGAPGLADR